MARPLQKKKNKSSLPRVRQKPKSKAVNIKSNPIVAAHWDQSLTLRQNYKRLGLSSRLKSSTGGIEKPHKSKSKANDATAAAAEHDGLQLSRHKKTTTTRLDPTRVRVERDEKGAIIGIIRTDEDEEQKRRRRQKKNPLNDPLNEFSSNSDIANDDDDNDEDERADDEINTDRRTTTTSIIPQLVESAKHAKRQRPRKQSEQEREWVERLVGKYGEKEGEGEGEYDYDYAAMRRDRKLNPMQQSEGDLKRRIAVWRREREKEKG